MGNTILCTLLKNEIGYSVSDNLLADYIVLTEGPSDKPVLEEFFKKLKISEKYNLKIWALGGDIMDQHDLSVFSDTYKVSAVIDKDPKSSKVRNRFVKNCKNLNIPVTKLKRYATENYFTIRALRAIFKNQISPSIGEILPDKKLQEQIGLDCKKNNRKIAKEMRLEEIEGTDFYDFLIKVKIEVEKKMPNIV